MPVSTEDKDNRNRKRKKLIFKVKLNTTSLDLSFQEARVGEEK